MPSTLKIQATTLLSIFSLILLANLDPIKPAMTAPNAIQRPYFQSTFPCLAYPNNDDKAVIAIITVDVPTA